MTTTPHCVGLHEIFDSTETADHDIAARICGTCPLLRTCAKTEDKHFTGTRGGILYIHTKVGPTRQIVGRPKNPTTMRPQHQLPPRIIATTQGHGRTLTVEHIATICRETRLPFQELTQPMIPTRYASNYQEFLEILLAEGFSASLVARALGRTRASITMRVPRSGRPDLVEDVWADILGGVKPATARLATSGRREVVARWRRLGRPDCQLAALTGWKVERYGLRRDLVSQAR